MRDRERESEGGKGEKEGKEERDRESKIPLEECCGTLSPPLPLLPAPPAPPPPPPPSNRASLDTLLTSSTWCHTHAAVQSWWSSSPIPFTLTGSSFP